MRGVSRGTNRRTPEQRAAAREGLAVAGAVSALTALTNARRPSASCTRAANPSENPPGWLSAATISLPSMPPIAVTMAPSASAANDHSELWETASAVASPA